MKRTWFLLGTLVVLAGCGSPEQNAIWTAEKAVANMLKDPESAKFNGSFFMPDGGNEQLKSGHVCGYVNAKNSFGAYVGSRRFVAPAIVGPDVVDVGNVTIDDGDTRFAIGTTETVFEKVYWNPSCVPRYKSQVVERSEGGEISKVEWSVQVASLSSDEKAEKLKAELESNKFSVYTTKKGGMNRVYVGPFSDRSSASSASSDLSERLGLNGFVVIKNLMIVFCKNRLLAVFLLPGETHVHRSAPHSDDHHQTLRGAPAVRPGVPYARRVDC
ncbi:TPA: SPOR domain-containing protein [Pseudomonas aeruginosa]|nr:SPOR domain-containing protein [Pseudomonas aeruginosa]